MKRKVNKKKERPSDACGRCVRIKERHLPPTIHKILKEKKKRQLGQNGGKQEETTKKLHPPLLAKRACISKTQYRLRLTASATDCFKSVGNERREKLKVDNLVARAWSASRLL